MRLLLPCWKKKGYRSCRLYARVSPYINKFRGRIMNIHPSLLPSPGLEGIKQALDYRVRSAVVPFI